MYSPIGIGPAASMRRRISLSSGVVSAIEGPPRMILSGAPQRLMLHGVDNKAEAGEEQRDRQQLPHGGATPQEAELRVRLAEEFAKAARQRVEAGEGADDEAGPLERPGADHEPEHQQQHQSFQRRLVQLARVARQRPAARKDNPPGQ